MKSEAYRIPGSIDQFVITAKVYDSYQINKIKYSILVYDKGALSNSSMFAYS